MDINTIIGVVTIVVTWILGIISKKSKFVKNELIPLQNLLIGILASVIYFIITKDFSLTITTVGLTAGGSYDIVKNLSKIINKGDE